MNKIGVTIPFPNFAGKHREDAFFTPAEYVRYLEREGLLPAGVILCYQPSLLRRVVERETVERVRRLPGEFYLLGDRNGPVGI